MPAIRPIRDLHQSATFSSFVKTQTEPVFVTKNGKNDMVVMSDPVYDNLMGKLEVYEKLFAAEAEIASGAELFDAFDVLDELRGLHE